MIHNLIDEFKEYVDIINNHDWRYDKNNAQISSPIFPALLINMGYEKNNYIKKAQDIHIKCLNRDRDNSEELTNDMLQYVQPNKEISQALKYIFYELTSNIYDHSKFDNGTVTAGIFPGYYEFCFMDNGISIPVSLKNSGYFYNDDCDAIIKAINGLSSKTWG